MYFGCAHNPLTHSATGTPASSHWAEPYLALAPHLSPPSHLIALTSAPSGAMKHPTNVFWPLWSFSIHQGLISRHSHPVYYLSPSLLSVMHSWIPHHQVYFLFKTLCWKGEEETGRRCWFRRTYHKLLGLWMACVCLVNYLASGLLPGGGRGSGPQETN